MKATKMDTDDGLVRLASKCMEIANGNTGWLVKKEYREAIASLVGIAGSFDAERARLVAEVHKLQAANGMLANQLKAEYERANDSEIIIETIAEGLKKLHDYAERKKAKPVTLLPEAKPAKEKPNGRPVSMTQSPSFRSSSLSVPEL